MLVHWKHTVAGGLSIFHATAKTTCTQTRAAPAISSPSSRDMTPPPPFGPLRRQQQQNAPDEFAFRMEEEEPAEEVMPLPSPSLFLGFTVYTFLLRSCTSCRMRPTKAKVNPRPGRQRRSAQIVGETSKPKAAIDR